MIASGNLVYLRTMEPSDAEALYIWENDPGIWAYGDSNNALSREDIAFFIASGQSLKDKKQFRYMICTSKEKRAVGCIDLFDYDETHQRAGVGILVYSAKDRRSGYGKEALELLKNYCRVSLNMKQLFCNVMNDNQPSISLFSGCEFELVGTKKSWRKTVNGWKDELLMQCLLV